MRDSPMLVQQVTGTAVNHQNEWHRQAIEKESEISRAQSQISELSFWILYVTADEPYWGVVELILELKSDTLRAVLLSGIR